MNWVQRWRIWLVRVTTTTSAWTSRRDPKIRSFSCRGLQYEIIWRSINENIFISPRRAVHPVSGRYLEVYSNQPGVQLYTSNFLPDPCGNVIFFNLISSFVIKNFFRIQINPSTFVSENYYEVDGVLTTKLEQVNVSTKDKVLPRCSDETAVAGKGGVHYLKHGAFCLETQKFPDAVHHVSRRKLIFPFHSYVTLDFRRKTSHLSSWIRVKFISMKWFSRSALMLKHNFFSYLIKVRKKQKIKKLSASMVSEWVFHFHCTRFLWREVPHIIGKKVFIKTLLLRV